MARNKDKDRGGTAVVERRPGAVAAFAGASETLQMTDADKAKLKELHGAGTSQAADDVLMPFIYVLQTNSPQCDKNDEQHIEGAEPGMFMRTDTKEVFQELILQPCAFYKRVNEWVPRDDGGGFIASHEEMPDDAKQHATKARWMTRTNADGEEHDLIDTRYHVVNMLGLVDGRVDQAVFTMKGTMHSVSRAWMVLQNKRQQEGHITPAWWSAYKFKTIRRENDQGKWYVPEVTVMGWLDGVHRQLGEETFKAAETGAKKINIAGEMTDDEGEGEDGKPGRTGPLR